jgi:hypothetical protein
MTTFAERRDAQETKFALDEELRFRALARRNRLFGRWAAERLGKAGAAAETYAEAIVVAGLAGDDDVIHKAACDLTLAKVPLEEAELRQVLDELMVRATEEVKAGA